MISTEDNDSDVAMYNEGTSLDSCTGHSSADGQYHYHANILCDQEAADPDTCKHIGYMRYKHAGEFVMDVLETLWPSSQAPHQLLNIHDVDVAEGVAPSATMGK